MKTAKGVLIGIVMLFTAVTAVLLLLAIFNITGSDETQKTIIKLAEASGVLAGALLVIFGLSSFGRK